jgi:hypothetical protein
MAMTIFMDAGLQKRHRRATARFEPAFHNQAACQTPPPAPKVATWRHGRGLPTPEGAGTPHWSILIGYKIGNCLFGRLIR